MYIFLMSRLQGMSQYRVGLERASFPPNFRPEPWEVEFVMLLGAVMSHLPLSERYFKSSGVKYARDQAASLDSCKLRLWKMFTVSQKAEICSFFMRKLHTLQSGEFCSFQCRSHRIDYVARQP